MDKLKGKSVLIGKEPERGRLLIAIAGTTKMGALGGDGSVPGSVSRCLPASDVAHARIDIDDHGHIRITNVKSRNVTYVDGMSIMSKVVTPASVVELGKDHYRIDVNAVLKVAGKLVGASGSVNPGNNVNDQYKSKSKSVTNTPVQKPGVPKPPKVKYSISHLELVWRDLQDQRNEIREKQKKVNLIRTGCSVFSMLTVPCTIILGPWAYALTGVGVIGTVYSFVGLKNDDTTQRMEDITEEFQDRYVCPNPECGKFLGNMSYKLLKKQYSMHCPYCKCEYVET